VFIYKYLHIRYFLVAGKRPKRRRVRMYILKNCEMPQTLVVFILLLAQYLAFTMGQSKDVYPVSSDEEASEKSSRSDTKSEISASESGMVTNINPQLFSVDDSIFDSANDLVI